MGTEAEGAWEGEGTEGEGEGVGSVAEGMGVGRSSTKAEDSVRGVVDEKRVEGRREDVRARAEPRAIAWIEGRRVSSEKTEPRARSDRRTARMERLTCRLGEQARRREHDCVCSAVDLRSTEKAGEGEARRD